jgi:hypothetical protein
MAAPMKWFRSNGGKVAWLAYFALACQLILTFGHIHLASSGLLPPAVAITTDVAGGSAAAPSQPAQRKAPAGLTRDICAVCSNISLANALVLPVSPVSIPTTSFVQELQWPPEAIGLLPRDHLYFYARGPPQV